MSLRRTVAAPFRQRGVSSMHTSEFVAAIAMDRGWYTPDQVTRLIDVAISEGLMERDDESLSPTFDVSEETIPADFDPGEDLLTERTVFERLLSTITDAGHDKQEAVGAINKLQTELDVTIEAAAVVYARSEGIDVDAEATQVKATLATEET